MPFAIAVLSLPASGHCLLVAAMAGLVYAAWVRGAFVAGFAGVAAALLALLAYLHAPPNVAGLAVLALGVGLLNAEFLLPTFGCAGAAGIAAVIGGSWWLLGPTATTPLRLALAVGAAAVLLAAVGRALRRATLPP